MRDEASWAAFDAVMAIIDSSGVDYEDHTADIAALFRERLWKGSWEGTLMFDDGLDALRFIQKAEHDKEGPNEPEWPGQLVCLVRDHYVYRLEI